MFFSQNGSKSLSLSEKRKRAFRIKLAIALSCVIVIFGSLVFDARNRFWRISTIEVSGNEIITEDEISTVAKTILGGSFLYVFPKDNILIYPRKNIKQELMNKFSRIRDVKISLTGFNSIKISVSERKANALWCKINEETEVVLTNDCYFMDDSGFVFSKAPEFSGDAYFKYYGFIENIEPIGKQYSDKFKKLSEFISSVSVLKKGLVTKFFAKGDGQFEIYEKNGTRIIWNEKPDMEKILENMQSFFSSDVYLNEVEKRGGVPFEYFDFRFGNKVYFK